MARRMADRLSEARAIDYSEFDAIKAELTPTIGWPRAEMIARLHAIFGRATAGPWKTYQNGVHPVEVGGIGSGEDYAICTHGPKGYENAFWIAAIHNDWPMIIEVLRDLAGRRALQSGGDE